MSKSMTKYQYVIYIRDSLKLHVLWCYQQAVFVVHAVAVIGDTVYAARTLSTMCEGKFRRKVRRLHIQRRQVTNK